MSITPGQYVTVTTASGRRLEMRALTAVRNGHDMHVVWVAPIDSPASGPDDPDAIPWPAESVERSTALTAGGR